MPAFCSDGRIWPCLDADADDDATLPCCLDVCGDAESARPKDSIMGGWWSAHRILRFAVPVAY